MSRETVRVGRLDELEDPGCREFSVGEGDWPFRGFVVRRGDDVFAYENFCVHAGHPLNWAPNRFLTRDRDAIICASHGAVYAIDTGRCTKGPCRGKSLRAVDVTVTDGDVYVSLSTHPTGGH